jgi:hypothetical protein
MCKSEEPFVETLLKRSYVCPSEGAEKGKLRKHVMVTKIWKDSLKNL